MELLGYKGEDLDRYVQEIRDVTGKAFRQPTVTDLKRWYSAKLINEITFRQYLGELGYSDEVIELFVKES